jgi:hypothetical protein
VHDRALMGPFIRVSREYLSPSNGLLIRWHSISPPSPNLKQMGTQTHHSDRDRRRDPLYYILRVRQSILVADSKQMH